MNNQKTNYFRKGKRFLGRIFRNLYFLIFMVGFLLATLLYFKVESNYEAELFTNIVENIRSDSGSAISEDSFAVRAMHITHEMLANRGKIFGSVPFKDFKAGILQPITFDLATANGACGSYSIVLARILRAGGMKVRMPQMEVDGVYGGHIVVEGKTSNGWVVMDPTFDVYFVRPDEKLASFADVSADWNYYKQQAPADYKPEYRYTAARFTNWNKIPIIFPATKKILDFVLGKKKADEISIRPIFLRKYYVGFILVLIILVPLSVHTLRVLYRKKKFALKSIDVEDREFIYPGKVRAQA